MVLDTALLNTQYYKVHIKGKVEKSRENNCGFPLHLDVVTIEKGAIWSFSTIVTNFTIYCITIYHNDYQLVIAIKLEIPVICLVSGA